MMTGEMKGVSVRYGLGRTDFRWAFLPYCLDRQEDGRWVVLNRDYKPLGMLTRDFLRYEEHPVAAYLGGLTAAARAHLDDRDNGPGRIYLYDDGSVPTSSAEAWEKYSRKLEVLAKLTVSTEPISVADKAARTRRELRAVDVREAVMWMGCTAEEAEQRLRRGERLRLKAGKPEWRACGSQSRHWLD